MPQTPKNDHKLFGTDGIRSKFGIFPLDKESVYRLGSVLGGVAAGKKIVIGRDTRASGEEIRDTLIAGMANRTRVFDCGVVPTPGLSYVTDHGDYDYGIMITASHNPYTDNGIKLFTDGGEKIPGALETKIEEAFFNGGGTAPTDGTTKGSTVGPFDPASKDIYTDFLSRHAAALKSAGLRLVLDCGHGATYEAAPPVFRAAGFEVETLNAAPDGKNINRNCGSTEPGALQKKVVALGADLGIAFDGDGDRVIFVDPRGRVLDGDHSLFAIARLLAAEEDGFNGIVVGTVVGNLGLEKALAGLGIEYVRTDVGDKHVYREMKRSGAILGGEQSGHTILSAWQKTGDGILTAIYFLKALAHLELTGDELYDRLFLYPQVTKSIPIRQKRDLQSWDELQALIGDFNRTHGDDSRILIRYSGTEPRIRVMIEAADQSVIAANIEKFASLIQSTIGE